MLETLVRDVRHSLRVLGRNPAFTLAALAALTLGIGANTAIFSVVNAVLLRPAPYPDAERVVIFMNTAPQGTSPAASPAKFQHYREQPVTRDVSAFNQGIVNLTGSGVPEQLRAGRVSADFFRLFGATPEHGRTFLPDEDRPLGPKVAVLSQRLWRARFEGNPAVIGQSISLSGEPHEIIGVLRDFDFSDFGPEPQVWVPFQLDPNTSDQGHYFQVAGRLAPGVSLEQARAQLDASSAVYRQKFPNALQANNSFSVQPVREALARNVRPTLLVMAGAVGFVLLIACANVANLLLVRAAGRKREIAIRAAIGGSRRRILRQLLTESVLLSLAGGMLGLGVGWAGIRALLAINTAGLPRIGQDGSLVTLDWRVLVFTLAVAVLTGVLFGLLPALHSSRIDLTSTLKDASGRSGTGKGQHRTRAVLVVAEVALATILLIGSALLIRTAVALARVDPGFDANNVLTMRMSLTGQNYESAAAVDQLVRNGVERLRALPGVVDASATCCVPLQGGYGLPFTIAGRPLEDGPFHGGGGWMTVSPGYFEVFRIPVRRGRTFDDRDRSGSVPVVVINEAMARQFWPNGGDPMHDRLIIGRGVMREFASEQPRQIIGVVADTRDGGLNADPQPQMFIPQAQVPDAANALNVRLSPMAWVIRTQGEPNQMSAAIQDALRQATGLPVANVRSMREIVSLSTSRQQFNMWLMSVFGGAALLLAAIGIYGLMAYTVAQRTQEIGIRLALGAHAAQLRRMVVLQGMRLALIGVVIGLAVSWLLSSVVLSGVISSFLYGVTTSDPFIFTVVPALLVLVALVAVWIPALRASRVDPIIAMRLES
jgi:predicted permease